MRAQLVFDAPVCTAAGDHFIVRDSQARHTIGGGVIIDPCAPLKRRGSAARCAYLDAIQQLLAGEGLDPLLQSAPHGVAMRDLVRLCGREPEQISLPARTRIVATPSERFAFLESSWCDLRGRALQTLRDFHLEYPDEPGLDRGRWRRMAAPKLLEEIWRVLIDDLLRQGAVRRRERWLHLPDHRVEFSDPQAALLEKLQAAIGAARFDPPWVRDLGRALRAEEDEVRTVLRKCASCGGIHQIVRDLFYHRDSVHALEHILEELELAHGVIEAARFRDAVALGRKRAIQILEFFDRVGYTRRIGDARKLRADSNWRDK
jgi:selenocysteine-specific elongation factor